MRKIGSFNLGFVWHVDCYFFIILLLILKSWSAAIEIIDCDAFDQICSLVCSTKDCSFVFQFGLVRWVDCCILEAGLGVACHN